MQIIFSKRAAKAIATMDSKTKARIKIAIDNLPRGDVKKLKNYTPAYRLRVGDWRILFDMGEIISIDAILPRGSSYK